MAALQEHAFAQTLDAIYDAAVDYDRWPVALELLGRQFDCVVACLVDRNLRTLQGRATASGIDQEGQREFFDVWGARNVFVQRTRRWQPGAIEPDRLILPKPELLMSDYYNGFMKPRDMHAIIRVLLDVEGERQQSITLVRPYAAGEYEAEDVEQVRRFFGHLQRAARLRRHLDDSAVLLDAVSEALEHNGNAVLLLDQDRRVVFANRAARRLAQHTDGIGLRRDRIELLAPREQTALRRLIAGALHRPGEAGLPANAPRGGVMRLPRPSGRPDLIATVAPLGVELARPRLAWAGSGPMALVVISDPAATVQPPDTMLRALFGLTATEIAVALAVVRGDSPAQAGERLGIKVATVRWHLGAVFRKTGTTRQSELVRLLLSLPTSLGQLPN